MFRSTVPVTEPAPDVDVTVPSDDLVPISHLELDLPAPTTGWLVELDRRGITVMTDDIGRPSVRRADARQLFDEQHEDEARRREVAARQEQAAIERDRAFRAALPTGLHWTDIPVGVSAADVWAQAEKDSRLRRRTPLEDALAGDGMVYRPLRDEEDKS